MDGTNDEVISISLYTLCGVVLNTFIVKYYIVILFGCK